MDDWLFRIPCQQGHGVRCQNMANGTWSGAMLEGVGTSKRHEFCASFHSPLLGVVKVLVRHIVRTTHDVQVYYRS